MQESVSVDPASITCSSTFGYIDTAEKYSFAKFWAISSAEKGMKNFSNIIAALRPVFRLTGAIQIWKIASDEIRVVINKTTNQLHWTKIKKIGLPWVARVVSHVFVSQHWLFLISTHILTSLTMLSAMLAKCNKDFHILCKGELARQFGSRTVPYILQGEDATLRLRYNRSRLSTVCWCPCPTGSVSVKSQIEKGVSRLYNSLDWLGW